MELSGLTVQDLPAVAALAGQLGYPSTEEQLRARFEKISNRSDHGVLVARLAQAADEPARVVGWIHFCARVTLASDERLELLGLVVDQSVRGQGIGSRLIEQAEAWGRARGLGRVRFTSQAVREDAHRLYRRLGYEVTKTSHVFEKSI